MQNALNHKAFCMQNYCYVQIILIMTDNQVGMRLKKVIEEYFKISPHAFSKKYNDKGGVKTSQVIRGRNGLSKKLLEQIITAYPEINPVWLLTGEGEMLKENIANNAINNYIAQNYTQQSMSTGKVIPFYDVQAAAGNNYGMDLNAVSRPSGMIEIGNVLSDSESAIRVYGNSMVPNYPAGCVIGLRPHTDSFIVPGHVYVVETRDNRYLKRLYTNKDKTALRCISDNLIKHTEGPMAGEYCYPEFEIPTNEIIRLYRVVGVIKRNIL